MPDVVTSNIDEVGAWIRELVGTFDFLMDVGSGILAEDVRDLIAEMIRKRSINFQQAPDGSIWFANARKYAKWKRKKFGVDNVGELTGQMLSITSLRGNSIVTPDSITMYYGIDQPSKGHKNTPVPSTTGKRKRKGGKKRRAATARPPTDTEKGEYFTDGSKEQNRPPRPFYDLDPQIEEAVFELIDEHLAKLLEG